MSVRVTIVAFTLGVAAFGCDKHAGSPAICPPGGAKVDPKAVVAHIGDQAITVGDVEDSVRSQVFEAEQKVYEIRKHGLDTLIAKRVLETRAKKENLTLETLLKRDVEDKLPQPPEDQMKSLYERAKAAGQPVSPTFEAD